MGTITNTIRWADNTAELRNNLRQGLDQIEATRAGAEKMVQALSGDKLLQAAHKYAAAVQEIGGVERLTAAEKERINALLDKAIQKYQALGQTAPQALRDLEAATRSVEDASVDWSAHLAHAIENPIAAVKSLGNALIDNAAGSFAVAGLAASAFVAALVTVVSKAHDLAQAAAQIGGQLNDMSEKTGIAVPVLSRLSVAAQIAGSDVGTLSNAVFMMQRNMAEGGDKFALGLQRINVSLEEFKALTPDQQLLRVSEGLKGVTDPAQRAAAAMEIFGRQGRDLLPTLLKPLQDLTQVSDQLGITWSERDAAAAEQFQMKSNQLHIELGALSELIGKQLIPAFNLALDVSNWTIAKFLTTGPAAETLKQLQFINDLTAAIGLLGQAAKAKVDIELPKDVVERVASYADQLRDAKLEVASLSREEIAEIQTAQRLGVSADEIRGRFALTEAGLRLLNEGFKDQKKTMTEAEAAAKKLRDAQRDLLAAQIPLTAKQKELATEYHKLGLTEKEIGELLHVATIQVKDYLDQSAKQLRMTEDVRKAQEKLTAGLVNGLNPAMNVLARNLFGVADSWNAFHGGITIAGDVMSRTTIPLFTTLTRGVMPQMKTQIDAATHSVNVQRSSLAEWGVALHELSGTFVSLSQIGGDSFGALAKDMGAAVTIGSQLIGTIQQTRKAMADAVTSGGMNAGTTAALATSWLGVGFAVLNFAAAMVNAAAASAALARRTQFAVNIALEFQSASTFTQQLTDNINTLTDTYFTLNKVRADVSGHGPQNQAEVEAIRLVSQHQAEAMHLLDIINELGGVESLTAEQTQLVQERFRLLFGIVSQGGADASKAIKQMDGTLAQFAANATKNGGMVDQFFLNALADARKMGIELQQVNAFLADQIKTNIIGGLTAFLNAASSTNTQVLAALRVTSQGAADAIAGALTTAFVEMQKAGTPIAQIIEQLGPDIDKLGAQLDAAGFSGGAVFAELRAEAALAKDEVAGPVIDALNGLGQTLTGLHNIGRLDQDTFAGLTAQIAAGYQALNAQGRGGLTALRLLQQPLQTVWQLQHDFGLAVDDATQGLLDQAEASGIVGEHMRPINEQILDATIAIKDAVEGIAHVFGVVLPSAITTAADKLRIAAGHMQDDLDGIHAPDLNVTAHVTIDQNGLPRTADILPNDTVGASTGALVTAMGLQRFARGGRVAQSPIYRDMGGPASWSWTPQGTDTIPAYLTPGEMVLNAVQQRTIANELQVGLDTAQRIGYGQPTPPIVLKEDFHFDFSGLQVLDGSDLDTFIEKKAMPRILTEIEDRRRGYAGRLARVVDSING